MKMLIKKTLLSGIALGFLALSYSVAYAYRGNAYYVNFMNTSDIAYEVVRVEDYCASNLPPARIVYKGHSENHYGFDGNHCHPGFTLHIKPEGSTATPAILIVDTNRNLVKFERNGHNNLDLDRTFIKISSHPWITIKP